MEEKSISFNARMIGRWVLINMGIGLMVPMLFDPIAYLSSEGWGRIWDDILYSFSIGLVISGTVFSVEHYFEYRIPWIKYPVKRFVLEFLAVSILGFVLVFIVTFLFFWLLGGFTLDNIPWVQLAKSTKAPMLIGYIITAFFLGRAFLTEWRQAAIDAEKLRAERYKGQVRLLKDQLNPHFLFNSLNLLTNTVYEDADKAAEHIRQLSKFYRYVLEVQDEEIVSVKQEIEFTQRYFNIQKGRFGEALQLDISVPNTEKYRVPPLVLQLLVENAIKHNAIGAESPLNIEIKQEGDWIVIRNNCNPKSKVEEGMGIGLNNIKERYRLLSDKEVEIAKKDDYFVVKLPLLTVD